VIETLEQLAYNLRWSWHRPTAELFDSLAPDVWAATHNPLAVVRELAHDPRRLDARGEQVLALKADLDRYLVQPSQLPGAPRIAYFCAEFAIADCLPIYSGGLGVLAGDHLKAASDLGLPLVGVGLLYRYGYFRQAIDDTGYQRENYDQLQPRSVPLRPLVNADGRPILVATPLPGRNVLARIWCAQVGRVPLYLLDTDLPENREDDRWISGHLYGGDQDTRLRQELVLGIGGLRTLRVLLPPDHHPLLLHMNEGHSAFVALELARERLVAGVANSFDEAQLQVAPRLAFTTHTPVALGHDVFPSELVEAYLASYRPLIGLTHEQVMHLGRANPTDASEGFSMTVLSLRSAARRNAVSQLHGVVSQEIWAGVGLTVRNVKPVTEMDSVTNGAHTATWVGPEMSAFFDGALGRDWRRAADEAASWRALTKADLAALWAARTAQRERLLLRIDARLIAAGRGGLASDVIAERALVIGFARRFALYKRAGLLLNDPDRLLRLVRGSTRPVVVVFAGKAHPRDDAAKLLVQRVVQVTRDERFHGRVVFLENYDTDLARLLVQGSDVWLNTPRPPLEASGTSGMKAALNGALHLSELDGWWDEAYAPGLGWALGQGVSDDLDSEARDAAEAPQLMDMLEREVVPLFFDRPGIDYPRQWTQRVARSIMTLAPACSAQRMVREYAQRVYLPAGATYAHRPGRSAAEAPRPVQGYGAILGRVSGFY
jgi:glycogen phosphorylase